MNSFKRWGQAVALAGLVTSPAWADDSDIYFVSGPDARQPSLVMLTLDWTPDLTSTQCSNALTSSCAAFLGEEIFKSLDLVDSGGQSAGNGGGPNGVADRDERSVLQLTADYNGLKVSMFDVLRSVFRILFEELDGVYLGFMISHDDTCNGRNASGPDELPSGSRSGCSNGAYVLQGFFDPADASARQNMNQKLAAIPDPQGNVSHPYQLKEMYFEYFRYLTGQAVHNGHLGYTDYGSSTDSKNLGEGGNDVDSALAWDGSIDTGNGSESNTASYISPFSTNMESDWSCSKVFAVNILDSGSNQEADSDNEIEASLANGGLALSSRDNDAEGVIAAMKDTDLASATLGVSVSGDQSVTSYFIADNVNRTTNGFATAGGTGNAFALGDPSAALESVRSIFREILSVSTTFVAGSVPVNVFNRSEVVDNVFLAVFKAQTTPWWPGNLKKLRIAELTTTDPVTGTSTTVSQIQDVDGDPAFAADDGRIRTDALTFWTDPTAADVVAFDSGKGEVSGKDGRAVTRGGAGQRTAQYLNDMPATSNNNSTRQLYYEPASGTNFSALNVADAPVAELAPVMGVSEGEARLAIAWARGLDVRDEDNDGANNDARPWFWGDPMHSRPLIVNYGTTGGYSQSNPNIHLMFGSNDGFFRIVRNTLPNTNESGEELFAFMPRAVMPNLPAWASGSPTTPAHPYGVDGEPTSLVIDHDLDGNIETGDGDKVYVYVGLRRGGNAYYALDVSSPTTLPVGFTAGNTPSLLWRIEQTSGGDFDELAMSFSTPRATMVNYEGTPRHVVIFTAGYNGGWSGGSRIGKDAGSATDSIGNAVYIVDAVSGELIWKATQSGTTSNQVHVNNGLVHSFPSTVTTFDSNANNVTDRLYVGDSGGALWRIDVPEGSEANHRRDNWKATKLAQLGNGSGADDRRFFHAPDVVNTRDGVSNYHGVIISSGNRANPLETTADNYLYLVKDRVLTSGATVSKIVDETNISTTDDLRDITDVCITGAEDSCASADLALGWKLAMEINGEKGLSAPLTAGGTIFATSYLPGGSTGSTCEPSEGTGRLYAIALKNGSAALPLSATINGSLKESRYTDIGPGIPPGAKPIGDKILLPGTGIDGNQIVDTAGRTRWKIYWREAGVDKL